MLTHLSDTLSHEETQWYRNLDLINLLQGATLQKHGAFTGFERRIKYTIHQKDGI